MVKEKHNLIKQVEAEAAKSFNENIKNSLQDILVFREKAHKCIKTIQEKLSRLDDIETNLTIIYDKGRDFETEETLLKLYKEVNQIIKY